MTVRLADRLASEGHPWPDFAAAVIAEPGRVGLDRETFASVFGVSEKVLAGLEDGLLGVGHPAHDEATSATVFRHPIPRTDPCRFPCGEPAVRRDGTHGDWRQTPIRARQGGVEPDECGHGLCGVCSVTVDRRVARDVRGTLACQTQPFLRSRGIPMGALEPEIFWRARDGAAFEGLVRA